MIKAVIFDLNGVFLVSRPLSKRVEEEYGIPGDKFWEALRKVLNETRKSNAESFFKLLRPYLKELNFSISEKEFFDFWFSGEKLVPEVLKYTKELRKKGIKVFILSRNFRERTEYYRENFPEIFKNINKAYFSWETGLIKPDPKAYTAILKENNLKPEECVYFDDSEENIKSAESLNIKAYKYEGLETTKEIISKLKER
jgi:putative hydrolase of the HAD superfamily